MDDIDMSEYYVVRRGEYHDMKAEIERLRKLVTELLPYAVNDAEQGISIGPPPEGDEFCKDCDQSCADCKWYNASVKFMVRYKAGEFSV